MSRTESAVDHLVSSLTMDLTEIGAHLCAAIEAMEQLEAASVGLNGLAPLLRTKRMEIGLLTKALADERDRVERKLRGSVSVEIVQTVDTKRLQAVRDAM